MPNCHSCGGEIVEVRHLAVDTYAALCESPACLPEPGKLASKHNPSQELMDAAMDAAFVAAKDRAQLPEGDRLRLLELDVQVAMARCIGAPPDGLQNPQTPEQREADQQFTMRVIDAAAVALLGIRMLMGVDPPAWMNLAMGAYRGQAPRAFAEASRDFAGEPPPPEPVEPSRIIMPGFNLPPPPGRRH